MNRKLWFPGGEPNINADDLMRNSNANDRAFNAALNAWLIGFNENFIISGCEITIDPGVSGSVTEGYIFLNKEILRVDAQVVAAGAKDHYYYEKQTTYDPKGTKTFKNLVVHETWQKNRGVLTNTSILPVPANKLDACGADWPQKVRNKIKGSFIALTPGDHDLTEDPNLNFARFDLSGSAATFRVDVPSADDQQHSVDINYFYFFESDPNLPSCTYNFFDQHGTQLAQVTHPEFSIILNNNGVWVEAAYIDLSHVNGDPALTEINIGDWDLKGTASISIPHTLANKDVLRIVNARIYNDSGSILYNFSTDGIISWDNTNIYLLRGSAFSGNDFQMTGFNRGTIYIQK